MHKKEDRRTTLTQRRLKDSLIEMLQEKDIYHISIRELCERADINRTTFYKYYGSQFDLMNDIEKDFINFINQVIEKDSFDSEKIIASICKYIEDNINLTRVIVNSNVVYTMANNIFSLETIKENSLKKYIGKKTDSELEYIYNFIWYSVYKGVF